MCVRTVVIVDFRSAKERPFAERKATLTDSMPLSGNRLNVYKECEVKRSTGLWLKLSGHSAFLFAPPAIELVLNLSLDFRCQTDFV